MINYYDILGVSQDASDDEIHEAYTFQIKAFHPDKYSPSAHPKQYARAVTMTQRLNEAKDTLLNPFKRGVYDVDLATGFVPEPPPRPSTPSRTRPYQPVPPRSRPPALLHPRYIWAFFGLLALLFLVSLQHLHGRDSSHTLGSAAQAAAAPTPTPCPTGTPTVRVTSVSLQPDPTAYMADELRDRRLYVISGTLTNATTDTIHADTLGFYLGKTPNFDLPPDWTDDLATLELSGDFTAIPAHSAITWKDKHVVDWPVDTQGPQPTTVLPVLKFPCSSTSKPESQWYWNDAQGQCPTTN